MCVCVYICTAEYQSAIVEAGCIDMLIKLLVGPSLTVRAKGTAVLALGNLAFHSECVYVCCVLCVCVCVLCVCLCVVCVCVLWVRV